MASNQRLALLDAHMKEMTKPSELRPVLTSLNGDNSWLMSFPVPPDEGPTATKHRKVYYHIVFDSWFQSSGAAVTVASWIIWAALTAQSTIQNGNDVEQIAREIELSAAKAGLVAGNGEPGGEHERMVDAIVISSRVTDHLHEESLRQFDRRIPVVAVPDAAVILNGWDYFDTVVSMQDMGGDDGSEWQGLHPKGPLPEWLTPFRLRESALNFAIVIVWSRGLDSEIAETAGAEDSFQHEALWVSPHGMHLDQPPLQAFLRDTTKTVNVLAMLHPLKEGFTWGWNTVLGVTGGLAVERALGGPKYWIPTANALLSYWGLVMLRVQDIPRTMEWGLAKEERTAWEKGKTVVKRQPNLVEVKSGESSILE